MSHKVLIIGLDGATFNVLRPFIDEGLLPNIKSMMDHGIYGTLNSTIPPISPPAWASFMTGKNPGKHGILHFSSIADIDDRNINFHTARLVGYRDIQTSTLFDVFRCSSKRIVSINLPLTYPPPETNGIVISDWLSPPNAEVFTYPPELSKCLGDYRIDQYFGGERFSVIPDEVQKKSEFMFADLTDVLVKRKQTALRLMRETEWDLFFVCFTEIDRVQHFFWRSINSEYRGESPSVLAKERELFRKFFREVDSAVGELKAASGPHTTTIIMSDHGFTAPPQRRFFMNYWLRTQGLFGHGESLYQQAHDWLSSQPVAKLIKKIVGRKVRRALRPAGDGPLGSPIPETAQAVGVGLINNWGGIFVRDGDRFISKIVSNQDKRSRVKQFLKRRLTTIQDPRTGKPIVEAVYDADDLYSGEARPLMPDLLVKLDPNYEFGYEGVVDTQERWLVLYDPPYPTGRGNHEREGVYIIEGPSVSARGQRGEYAIEDILPTAFSLLAIQIPEDTDGKPIPECIPASLKVKLGPAIEKLNPPPLLKDDAMVREKLRSLGYL